MFEILSYDNFLLFAAKHYVSPYYIEKEFFDDLKRIKYIKRLIQKYSMSGELREKLILNHIIMVYNVFDHEACTRMLFLKIRPKDYSALKTFLVFLNFMPDVVKGIDGKDLISSDINIDFNIASVLRQI
jgi:hypothetical protein